MKEAKSDPTTGVRVRDRSPELQAKIASQTSTQPRTRVAISEDVYRYIQQQFTQIDDKALINLLNDTCREDGIESSKLDFPTVLNRVNALCAQHRDVSHSVSSLSCSMFLRTMTHASRGMDSYWPRSSFP